jgi:diguanylate cyclase (GGDEF)-like protein/PAS domain S-box-containing protein
MKPAPVQMTAGDLLEHRHLYRRLRFWAVLGVLLTGLVVGGIFTTLLYHTHKETVRAELYYESELLTQALNAELSRLFGIAHQLTTRTRIRQELERFNRGEIGLDKLASFTLTKLQDPIDMIPELKGIARLDQNGQLTLALGEVIPRRDWPARWREQAPALGTPRATAAGPRLPISAPILGRDGERVGTDIVLLDNARLRELMVTFHRRHPDNRSLFLATILPESNTTQTLLAVGGPAELFIDPSLLTAEVAEALAGQREGGLHRVMGQDSGQELRIVHSPLGETGWALIMLDDTTDLFSPAQRQTVYAALAILLLVVLGTSSTWLLVRRLVASLIANNQRLATLNASNQRLLEEKSSNESLFQSILDNTPSMVYVKDLKGRYELINAAFEKFSGSSREQIRGRTDRDLFPSWVAERTQKNEFKVIETDRPLEFDEQAPQPDGIHDYLSVRFPLRDREGRITAIGGISNDITDRKAAESRLRQSAKVFESSGEGLVITDPQGHVVDTNPAFTRIMGYEKSEVLGRNPNLWKSDRHPADFYADLWSSIAQGQQWRGEVWNRRKDGSLIPVLLTINTVRNDAGQVLNYVAVYSDISSIKKTQAELERLAHYDVLTGLPNRVLFLARVTHAIDRAQRSQSKLAVLFLDLDQFKHINDSLGHNVGDKLLSQTAELLKRQLRRDDTVARIGGDEFTFLLEEVPHADSVILVVEKILRAFEQEFMLAEHRLRVTASLGIAIFPDDGADLDTLLRNADSAMYRAKADGRNTYRFYTEALTREAMEHVRLETGLGKAIENRELQLHYQPQVELSTGHIMGMEVLLRWHPAQSDPVPPDKFIPIAEDSGLIHALDEWVMASAFQQARLWLDSGLTVGTLSVNISGKEVTQGGLAERVESLLRRFDLPPRQVELELTERFIMGQAERDLAEITRLRELGVTLAVDDFGTGYSSLAYLKTLPINRLKIDKSFIRDIPDDANDTAITRAIVAMCQSLRLDLVAEGVETDQQRDFLLSLGCGVGQGYLFSRPVPAEQMQRLLENA